METSFNFPLTLSCYIPNLSACNAFLKNRPNAVGHWTVDIFHPNSTITSKTIRRFTRIADCKGNYLLAFRFFDSLKKEIPNLTIIIDLGKNAENLPDISSLQRLSFSKHSCKFELKDAQLQLTITT